MDPPERVSCLPTYRPQDFKLVNDEEELEVRTLLLHRHQNPVNPLRLANPLPQQAQAQAQALAKAKAQAHVQVQDEKVKGRWSDSTLTARSRSTSTSQSASNTRQNLLLLVVPGAGEGLTAQAHALSAGVDANANTDTTSPWSPPRLRTHSTNTIDKNKKPPTDNSHLHSIPRSLSFPSSLPSLLLPKTTTTTSTKTAVISPPKPALVLSQVHASNTTTRKPLTKQARLYRRNNGLEKGPPPAMITQGSYKLEIDTTSTTDSWVASQQIASSPSPLTSKSQPLQSPAEPLSARSFDSTASRPLIKPIRGFKPSSRKSTEMALRRTSEDAENTLRALEGYELPRRISDPSDEAPSDESDMFLRAAREEESPRQRNGPGEALTRLESRRSRVGRSSLVPSSHLYQPSLTRRRGSDQESIVSRSIEEQGNGNIGQVLTYRPSQRDSTPPSALDENKSRFHGSYTRSSPTTPRALASREMSPESPIYQGRRGSIPDPTSVLPSRQSTYRQSNLSYSTPRNYNSSPLVSRMTDMQETPAPETGRTAEGTESTVSTTAPSTVWDELEDLKSRINRLELTRKLPATSGAAMSRASNDRPPTATTTVTTMSTSPKQRGRGNSVSPVNASGTEPPELHPLLHSALAKSKPLLSAEIYSALEATAADALTIAAMMGTSGQPGPISSSQSTLDRPTDRPISNVSDRQVRRKADSMCRSLTELCLALSDGKVEHAASASNQITLRPVSRDTEVLPSIEQPILARPPISTDLARVKASPRALSSLEARRSSALGMSALPSPRYTPSDSGTPTQATMAGRRSSMLVRSRRGNTEEPEEKDDFRFRAPSRAFTEIGRFKNLPREPVQQEPIPDRALTVQSSLPVRRHVATSSLPNAAPSPAAAPVSRKYLDRPAVDSNGPIGRIMEHRKSSIGTGSFGLGRTSSLNRRQRPSNNNNDSSVAGQYQ